MHSLTNTPPDAVKLYWGSRGFSETQFWQSAAQRTAERSSGRTWTIRTVRPSVSWKQPFTCSERHSLLCTSATFSVDGERGAIWHCLLMWSNISTSLASPMEQVIVLGLDRHRAYILNVWTATLLSLETPCALQIEPSINCTTMSQTICVENLKTCCILRGANARARWNRWT